MDLLLDILQAAGVAAAIGLRPAAPALLVGVLALLNLGVDFEGTAFAFLESPITLVVLAVLLVAAFVLRERIPGEALLGLAAVLGALFFAAQLDDRHDTWWYGLVLGALIAAGAAYVARGFFDRVRTRLDADAAGDLPIYAEAAATAGAGLSVALPPLGLVVVGFLASLARGGKRREGEKYAGLRILR